MTTGFLYYSPFSSRVAIPPFSLDDRQRLNLRYSAVADHAIVYTNSGVASRKPYPEKILQLWEAPISQTDIMATLMRDDNDTPVGLGIKFSSRSERTRVLNGEALVDSAWYVYLPEHGTMLIAQSENYWNYLRDIVVPAHWSSGNAWRGDWQGTITSGPGRLGTARVHGGSGSFAGIEAEAVESLSAKAYSTEIGPVSMDGHLTIELPGKPVADPAEELAAVGAQ